MAGRSPSEICPFVPGPGATPPILAGRAKAQERIGDLCARLCADVGAHRPVIVIGPRGNGKTVILNWLQEHCQSLSIESLRLTPNQIPTVEALAERLGDKPLPGVKKAGLTAGVPELLTASGNLEFHPGRTHAPPDLIRILVRRMGGQPLALLIDEAHTLEPGVVRHLLNAAQDASKEEPFLLVLAGTPDLGDKLRGVDATFWSRSMKIGVGLLHDEDVLLAISEPLRWFKTTLREQRLWAQVISDSQGYPFFVQQWGEELWLQARNRANESGMQLGTSAIELSDGDVENAAKNVAEVKREYYGDRYTELLADDLLDPARAIANAFSDGLTPSPQEVLQAIVAESVGAERAYGALTSLAHSGFVWKPPGEDAWGPGIPSLMDYVISLSPALKAQAEEPPGP